MSNRGNANDGSAILGQIRAVETWMATGEILLGHNPPFTSVLFAYAGAHQIAEPEYLIIGFGVQLGG